MTEDPLGGINDKQNNECPTSTKITEKKIVRSSIITPVIKEEHEYENGLACTG